MRRLGLQCRRRAARASRVRDWYLAMLLDQSPRSSDRARLCAGGRPRPLLHDQVPSVGEFIGRAKASSATATLDGPAKANRSWC